MYDVEGTLRCGDPRAGTRFRALASPTRRHLAFDKTSLVGAWHKSAPRVHCSV